MSNDLTPAFREVMCRLLTPAPAAECPPYNPLNAVRRWVQPSPQVPAQGQAETLINAYRGAGMSALGLPVPPSCPLGLSPRRWAGMSPEQCRYVLLNYWRTLTPQTRELLDLKYGNRVETTRAVRSAAWEAHHDA